MTYELVPQQWLVPASSFRGTPECHGDINIDLLSQQQEINPLGNGNLHTLLQLACDNSFGGYNN